MTEVARPLGHGSTDAPTSKSASAECHAPPDLTMPTYDIMPPVSGQGVGDHPVLSVATYNCEGLLSALPYVGEMLCTIDIVFLAETWISRAEECLLPRFLQDSCKLDCLVVQEFAMDLPPGAGEGRRHGGVALICRNRPDVRFTRVRCDNERLCGVTVCDSVGPCLTVIGCYMPYWDSGGTNLNDFADLVSQLDVLVTAHSGSSPTLLVGDFNCALPRMAPGQRPQHWYDLRGFSPCSAIMQQFLDDHNLTVAEFKFPQPVSFTYERGSCRTHIDHIAVPNSFIDSVISCDIEAHCVENLSPHLPISIGLHLNIRAGANVVSAHSRDAEVDLRPYVLKWNCSRRNELYLSRLEMYMLNVVPRDNDVSAADIDALDAEISRCIHAAARESGCARPRRPPKVWWTPAVSAARDKARFWFRLWTESGRQLNCVVYACYCQARREYRRARKHAARARLNDEARLLHTLQRDRNINAFWRRVNFARRGQQHARSELTVGDFADHFGSVNQEDDSLSPAQLLISDAVAARLSAGCNASDARVVSAEEVSVLIRRLKRNTAPGIDNVTVEHLLYGESQALLTMIACLLSACLSSLTVPQTFTTGIVKPLLKKPGLDPNSVDNYRPISLATTMSKLLECLLLSELCESFSPNDLQFGFIENRSTTQASLLVTETVQWHVKHGSPVFAANLDAHKCFDRIWHDGLFFRLRRLLSPQSWHLLVKWYRRLTARVHHDGYLSECFAIKRGTRQGAILSPALANVFFEPLVSLLDSSRVGAYMFGCHVPAICYADDLMLLSTNVRGLATLLLIVEEFASMWRLDFVNMNPTKTKSHCIVFGAEYLSEIPVWYLSGQQLSVRSVTEHLGVVISSDLSGSQHAHTV